MIKINLHKNLSDFFPFRRYPRKIAFFTTKLYISDVYHIFLNRRDVKAYENQCFVWSLVWYRYVKFQALAHGLLNLMMDSFCKKSPIFQMYRKHSKNLKIATSHM